MEIKVNKEIRNYTESIAFGLNLRQCFFSVTACIIAVIIYFICIDHLGLEVTSWFCMLGAAPFAALGFVTYQGMNAEQIFVTFVRSLILQHTELIDEPYNLYYEIMKDYINDKQKEGVKKHAKKLCKNKKTEQRKI